MQLALATWILLALAALTLCLDAWAIAKLCMSPFYEPGQRWAQAALVLCVPVAGALLVLYMAHDSIPVFQSPPMQHDPNFTCTAGDLVDDPAPDD